MKRRAGTRFMVQGGCKYASAPLGQSPGVMMMTSHPYLHIVGQIWVQTASWGHRCTNSWHLIHFNLWRTVSRTKQGLPPYLTPLPGDRKLAFITVVRKDTFWQTVLMRTKLREGRGSSSSKWKGVMRYIPSFSNLKMENFSTCIFLCWILMLLCLTPSFNWSNGVHDWLGWGGSGAPEQQLKTLLVATKLGKVRPLHPKRLQSWVTLTSPKEKEEKGWASRLERLRCHEQIVYCVYSSLHSTLWGVLCNTLVEMLNMSVEEYRMGRGKANLLFMIFSVFWQLELSCLKGNECENGNYWEKKRWVRVV